MITEKITIYNDGTGMNEALSLTQKVSDVLSLDRKNSFHIRLLAEELLSMVRAITGDFKAQFWLEENNRLCTFHVEAKSELDYKKRKDFLSVSTTGKNIAHLGIMEKIRGLIEAGLNGVDESFKLQAECLITQVQA